MLVFLILSWIYGINCRKYVVLENCCFPVYGKCQEICKRSYIISERACVGCVGELHTCREEATIHAVQLQAAHNYLLLCIGDGSLEDNSFRPSLLYPRSSI